MSTRRPQVMKSWLGQVTVIGMVLLTVAAGFCIFHADQDGLIDHGMSPDACASVLIVLAATLGLTSPVINGWLVPVPKPFVYAVSPDLLDRPPELFSFA